MTTVLYVIIYAAVVSFLIACIARVVMYARQPVHLRWELYPVPHEEARRVAHGGSYFESVDWWTQPTHANRITELKFMVPEIIFLKGLWEFNRKLWYRSFPFHFGLYLLIAAAGALTLSALLAIFAPAVMESLFGIALALFYTVAGAVGVVLAIAGAVGLLLRRLTDDDLKNYTTPGDIFNLVFFIGSFAFVVAGYATTGPDFPGVRALVQGLLTFDTSLEIPGVLAIGLILSCLLVAYIPLTHMSHFIAKYFTYHSVRWDDLPTARSAALKRKLAEYLTYRPSWAAPHMVAGDAKTWADIATTNPAAGGEKR